MNVDRLVCGLAVVWNQRSQNGAGPWTVGDFDSFLQLDMAIPVQVEHGVIVTPTGVIRDVGAARRFADVRSPVPGLLALAEIDSANGWGDSLFDEIRRSVESPWFSSTDSGWGLSIGAFTEESVGVHPYELSLTRRPAIPDARVLAVGPEAATTWELLTGEMAALQK